LAAVRAAGSPSREPTARVRVAGERFRHFGNYGGMMKSDQCQQNAIEAIELARKAASPEDKARLLAWAEKWMDLTERFHRSPRKGTPKAEDCQPDGGYQDPTNPTPRRMQA
jgi:hypothetical protein